MRRVLRRWAAGVAACLGTILLISVLMSGLKGGNLTSLLPVIVLGLILAAFWPRWIRLKRYDRQTFDWYQKNNPERVQRGRISCKRCESDQIGTQPLHQHTYTRAHFCSACGTTLYYSQET